jgi:hypothetical protein
MAKWDYVCVNLVRSYGMNYRRNGIKMGDWKNLQVFEMLAIMGEDGFELATYDGANYIFKRQRPQPQQAAGVSAPAGARPAGQPGQPGMRPAGQPGQPGMRPAGQPGQPMSPGQRPPAPPSTGIKPVTKPLQRPTPKPPED